MKEIWRKIKDYEGIYEVSNLGNVKSLERKENGNSELSFENPFLNENIPYLEELDTVESVLNEIQQLFDNKGIKSVASLAKPSNAKLI